MLQPFTFKEATASEGLRTGARKRQAMQSGTHFAKTGGFRLHGTRLFRACWGAAPIPAEHKTCVLKRWINPSAARLCKSLMDLHFKKLLENHFNWGYDWFGHRCTLYDWRYYFEVLYQYNAGKHTVLKSDLYEKNRRVWYRKS